MISSILILGGGSAGLIAAVTLKRRLPELEVRVVRSPEIGIIGVGEGTTAAFPRHFFDYLGFSPRRFYADASPTWKLGIRFLWGKQKDFFYGFVPELGVKYNELPRSPGYYVGEGTRWTGPATACMAHERAFFRQKNGAPDLSLAHAFHIENKKLVGWLEQTATSLGVTIIDGTMREAERGPQGIAALHLESGETLTADLFIDASGFRSELLRRTLDEPWVSYSDSLFCDRAVIGGWPRTDEPISPYTVAETMNAGWCWRIEHEHWINRGYVYSSAFLSDEEALAEFLAANPKVANEPRVVRFRSGRTERNWVGNVVGIGNANGFVEPLEATALQMICDQSQRLAECLRESLCEPTPSLIAVANRGAATAWNDVRDFLAVHYAFNDRLDTPFWLHCRSETKLGGAEEFVRYYQENGPGLLAAASILSQGNSFGADGYYALLLGQGLPHARPYEAPPAESARWGNFLSELAGNAQRGATVEQALTAIRSPSWTWER